MDILMIKVSDGKLITHFKFSQDYSSIADMVTAVLLRFHPGKTADAYALCDAVELQDQVDGGKTLTVGDVGGGGDFDVMLKSAVTSETIIPPDGILVSALLDGDDVRCHATVQLWAHGRAEDGSALSENLVVGAPCGVMDQMTSSCGGDNELLSLLCQPAELLSP